MAVLITAPLARAQDAVTYEQTFRDLYDELGRRYPCFELKQIDWDAVGEQLLPRAAEVADDEAFGLLCMELVARLEDSHAQLLEGDAQLPGAPLARWHPGFACLLDDRGQPVVYAVAAGGPAANAGIRPGMTVISIDGKPAGEAIEQTMAELRRWIGYSSEQALRYAAVRQFNRRMEHGRRITVVCEDVDGRSFGALMAAVFEHGYIPRLPVPSRDIADAGDMSWKMLRDNIGYIYVRRINEHLVEGLDHAVAELADADALIIDVRGNSGGGFDGNVAFRNFTLDPALRDPARPVFTGPIAVLIDAACISAGEGWASWFIAEKRATFFGEPTAGASARKDVYTLTNGKYKVRFPVKAYKGFLDRPIERVGLVPDVEVKPTAQDLAAARDTVLETARAYLLEQVVNQMIEKNKP